MSVRACRLRCGFSQTDVIGLLGCSTRTVQRWDDGRLPRKRNVRRLCALFGVGETELLRAEPTPEPDMEKVLALVDRIGVEAFCDKTLLAPLTIENWRVGTRANPGTLRLISERLGVPVKDLLTTQGGKT